MANVLKRKPGQAKDKKQMSNVGKLDMTAFQSRIMRSQDPAEKLALATDMINQMVILLSQPSFLLKTLTSKHLKRKFLVQF